MKAIGAAWLLVLACALQAAGAQERVDLGPYVDQDRISNIKISPTGEYYAASVPVDDQTGLVIMRRSDHALTATFRFSRRTHVHDFWWVNDERVLMSVAESFGSRDAPSPTGELYAINADGSRRGLLVGWRMQERGAGSHIGTGRGEGLVAAHLIDPLPDEERHVLVSVRPFVNDPSVRVERMDVNTGRRTRVASVPVQRASFVTDNRSEVRFALGANADNVSRLYYRASNRDGWTLLNDEGSSGLVETPLGFSDDDATAYLRVQRHEGPDAIVALDVASGERREILRDAVVDPVTIYRDGWGPPVGVRYLGSSPRTVFFDPASADARLYRSLEAAFPGRNIEIPSATAGGGTKIMVVSSDVDPGSFYAYDSRTFAADFLFPRRERIDPGRMAPMRGVAFAARDGLTLHGFLTVPRESDGTALPMVVLPHGGPYGIFDSWGFDGDTQVLAEAGYAVLRINFRGSGNYGRAFLHAGAREWGGAMQDDLTDATRWAIAQGLADPARICIYGASYGAYAALMGVAREPDLYRCAVGYVGVYDLPRMQGEDRRQGRWLRTWTREWIGEDDRRLAGHSPNRIAGRIRAPVLLAAGGEDQVAPIEHSRLMERALDAAGVEVETLYYPNEGHGFSRPEHRREFYRRLLDFLDRHLRADGTAGR